MSGQPARLPHGGLIDRGTTLRFRFDGREMPGHPGDTLGSALLANGVRLVGRSFKYHRPRGILSAGPEEPNALVELRRDARREPNTRATEIELFEGLEATSQNRWPSLALDLLAVNGLAAPLLKAGFYYKTFMWPASFWEKLYEPLIRRAAGLGRASGLPDPDRYERATAHCDLLVVGSGPAGLAAALSAARAGARVILAERDPLLGGRILEERLSIGGRPALAWRDEVLAELAACPDVRLMPRMAVFGTYDQGVFGGVERVSDHLHEPPAHLPRQRYWRLVARRSLVAAGAIERPIVFGGNDRPGVMLAGAVRSYVNRFAVLPGREAVVFATTDDAARTVEDIVAAGGRIAAVVDPRPEASVRMAEAAERASAPLYSGTVVTEAHGSWRGLAAVSLHGSGAPARVACDLVAMSGGWTPTIHLTSHLGHKPAWNPQIAAFVPDRLPEGMRVAGAASGAFTLADALATGAACGAAAAEDLGFARVAVTVPEAPVEAASGRPLWRVRGARSMAFVDFQNDVTDSDLELAEREGFRSSELAKRYTTLGMATDGGKTSAVSGVALMAELTGRDIGAMGATTFRPPFVPIAMGALAGHARGRHLRPTRLTPAHDAAASRGAVFVEAGAWLRAQYFPATPAEDWLTAAHREVAAVRERVGVCDVSTLGKIDVQGSDAAAFLDFVYANTMSTLPVGRCRYGLMLREDGFVLDDGTAARLAPDHFVLSTTTANAGRVMQHLDACAQVLRPELDVQLASVTDQWAQFAIAGPRARDLLARMLDSGLVISNAAFPHTACAEASACGGVPARVFRLSFSGELGFELAVPARYGDAAFRRLLALGEDLGAAPYGTEALSILRIEKGHVAGGELNGQTTAADLGLGRMLSAKKDFIGRMLARRPALTAPDRQVLVGLWPLSPAASLSAGAHLIEHGGPPGPHADLGHVTSTANSPTLGRTIGLGLLAGGAARIGSVLLAHDPVRGRDTMVEVRAPVFHDPEGGRLRA
jgi:sarcosine oxidase subunit alpha